MKPSAARVAKKWKNLPKGWTDESVRKFWDTMTKGAPKHPVTKCIKEMDGKVGDPGAFCGGLADWMEGKSWRKESATINDSVTYTGSDGDITYTVVEVRGAIYKVRARHSEKGEAPKLLTFTRNAWDNLLEQADRLGPRFAGTKVAKRIRIVFYECEHTGDAQHYQADLESSGARVITRRLDLDEETCSFLINVDDPRDFSRRFRDTVSAEFSNLGY